MAIFVTLFHILSETQLSDEPSLFFTKMSDYARAHQIQEPPLPSNQANSQEKACLELSKDTFVEWEKL